MESIFPLPRNIFLIVKRIFQKSQKRNIFVFTFLDTCFIAIIRLFRYKYIQGIMNDQENVNKGRVFPILQFFVQT